MRFERAGLRQFLVVLVVVVLMAGIFGTLHIIRFQKSILDNYYGWTTLQAQVFAERIHLDLPVADILNLTRFIVSGKTLFAQVIREGEIIARDPLGLSLEEWEFEGRMGQREGVFEDDTRYIEVYREIPQSNSAQNGVSPAYVRVGFSLQEIENKVLQETLLVIVLGIVAVSIVSLFGFLYLFRKPPQLSGAAAQSVPEQVFEPTRTFNGDPAVTVSETKNGNTEPEKILIEAGPLHIDQSSKEVFLDGEQIELSPKEYELISFLASAPDRVFSNREILEQVWSDGFAATAKDVKQYIYLLRRKLENNPEQPELIVTVRGFGYKLVSTLESGN